MVDKHLHGVRDVFSLGEDLGEVLGAEDVSQGSLSEQSGRMVSILDVCDRHDCTTHSVIDDSIYRHCHGVFRQHLRHTNYTISAAAESVNRLSDLPLFKH